MRSPGRNTTVSPPVCPHRTLAPRYTTASGSADFIIRMAALDFARRLEDGERLFIKIPRNLHTAVPATQCLVAPDAGGQHFDRNPRKEAGLLLGDFCCRSAADPFARLTKSFEEGAARSGTQKVARATQAAESDRRHGLAYRGYDVAPSLRFQLVRGGRLEGDVVGTLMLERALHLFGGAVIDGVDACPIDAIGADRVTHHRERLGSVIGHQRFALQLLPMEGRVRLTGDQEKPIAAI